MSCRAWIGETYTGGISATFGDVSSEAGGKGLLLRDKIARLAGAAVGVDDEVTVAVDVSGLDEPRLAGPLVTGLSSKLIGMSSMRAFCGWE
ncbi:MAG: hypothetical protein ABI233_06350 [Chthoniobacterales bacterium]